MRRILKIPTILILILIVSSSYVFAGLVASEIPLIQEASMAFFVGMGLVGLGNIGRKRRL